ncbi:MAG: DUF6445 family protein [Pseudomonadota bacterium]
MRLRVNKRAKPEILWVDDNVPMLVVNDFYQDPEGVREEAMEREFKATAAGYPGRHEYLNPDDPEVRVVMNHIHRIVQTATGIDFSVQSISTDFSILTTPRKQVLASQSHPHIDGVALAGLVYLNQPTMGGTCFYRNKLLGSSVVTDDNVEEWEALNKDPEFRDEVDDYVSDSFSHWELIHKTEGRFNQFVTYPGNVFHSVDVVVDPDPSDPKSARLTQRVFVDSIPRTQPNP